MIGFMNFQEWRGFSKNILAGIFGGLVVAGWQLSYELLSEAKIWIRILVPSLVTLVFFVLMILFLRWLFLKKEEKQKFNKKLDLEPKNVLCKSLLSKIWEPEDKWIFGILFIMISFILLQKYLLLILPISWSPWIYIGISFLFLLISIKILKPKKW